MSLGFNAPDTTIGYIGNSAVLISKLDANDKPIGGFFNVGQISSAVLALSTDKVEMMDMVYGTGGVAKSKIIKTSGELTINMRSYSPEVMEMALFGKATADIAEVGVKFTGQVYKNRSINVNGVISAVTSVTVEGATDPLEDGVDYVASNGTIHFFETAAFEDGDTVNVIYDKAAVQRIEGMVNTSVKVMIIFDARNTEESDVPVKVTYYKVSLSPAAARNLVSSDFDTQEIKGTVEVSRFVTGSGLSKMFKEEHVKAS